MKAGPHKVEVLFNDSATPAVHHAVVVVVLGAAWVTLHEYGGDVVSYPAVKVHRITEHPQVSL